MGLLFGGLDVLTPDALSAEERDAFEAFYDERFGHQHLGLHFMLENRADALKRFRLYVRVGYARPDATETPYLFGFLAYYALLGYAVGTRYLIRVYQQYGFNREQCLDAIAIAGLVAGPLGFETIARGLADYAWIDPVGNVGVPAGWDPDLRHLSSGLDYSTPTLTADELDLVRDWYRKWLGVVPAHIEFMARYHPEALKAYRNRFEHCLRSLPKQALPMTLLHFNVLRGCEPGIRENVLLARGFGVTKQQVIRTLAAGMEYGGIDNIAVAEAAVADVLDGWDDDRA